MAEVDATILDHTKIRQPKIAVLEARCFVSRWESALTAKAGAERMGRVRIGRMTVLGGGKQRSGIGGRDCSLSTGKIY